MATCQRCGTAILWGNEVCVKCGYIFETDKTKVDKDSKPIQNVVKSLKETTNRVSQEITSLRDNLRIKPIKNELNTILKIDGAIHIDFMCSLHNKVFTATQKYDTLSKHYRNQKITKNYQGSSTNYNFNRANNMDANKIDWNIICPYCYGKYEEYNSFACGICSELFCAGGSKGNSIKCPWCGNENDLTRLRPVEQIEIRKGNREESEMLR